ncbi:MAG: FAD/NAD(P)-binding protein [Myxococcota bacterium]
MLEPMRERLERTHLVGVRRGVGVPARTVAVVGGGYCGTLTVVQLLRAAQGPLRILWYDQHGRFARGLAYSTPSFRHLLNVPAASMSALVEEPEHFLHWLRRRQPGAHGLSFAPRALYGRYLEELLEDTTHQAQLKHGGAVSVVRIQDEVVRLYARDPQRGVLLTGRDTPVMRADMCVLATGNAPAADPRGISRGVAQAPGYHGNPWHAAGWSQVEKEDDVLIIGTGLTAIDLILSLQELGHRGQIVALSRRGSWPEAHRPGLQVPEFDPEAFRARLPVRLTDVIQEVRETAQQVRSVQPDGWRLVVDALRPRLSSLWQGWDEHEQRQFLRHVRPHWEVVRHRMAPEIETQLQGLERLGQVRRVAGRLLASTAVPGGIALTYQLRRAQAVGGVSVKHVFNCTGLGMRLSEQRTSLVQQLLTQGLVTEDVHGLGARCDAQGALIDADGRISEVLFTVGGWRRAQRWESTAVPELRAQTYQLARVLLTRLATQQVSA